MQLIDPRTPKVPGVLQYPRRLRAGPAGICGSRWNRMRVRNFCMPAHASEILISVIKFKGYKILQITRYTENGISHIWANFEGSEVSGLASDARSQGYALIAYHFKRETLYCEVAVGVQSFRDKIIQFSCIYTQKYIRFWSTDP